MQTSVMYWLTECCLPTTTMRIKRRQSDNQQQQPTPVVVVECEAEKPAHFVEDLGDGWDMITYKVPVSTA